MTEIATVALLKARIAELERLPIGVIDTLIESLMEGLMTDAGLTTEDRVAMQHQIEALEVAASDVRAAMNRAPA